MRKLIGILIVSGALAGCYGVPAATDDAAALAAKNAAKLEQALIRAQNAAMSAGIAPLTTAEILHDRALAQANTGLVATIASWTALHRKS